MNGIFPYDVILTVFHFAYVFFFLIRSLLVLISLLLLRFKLMEYVKCLRLQRFSFSLSFFCVPIRIYLYHERKHLIRFILLRFAFMMRSSFATLTPTQNFIHSHRTIRFHFCVSPSIIQNARLHREKK